MHTDAVTQRSLYTESFNTQARLHTETFTQRSLYRESFFAHGSFQTQKFLRSEAFTHRRVYTQARLHTEVFTQRHPYTEVFTCRSFYTQKLSHREVFTQRSLYTEKLLHTGAFTRRSFYTEKSLHREVFTCRSFYTQKLSHREVFTQRNFYTQKLLHTEASTQRSLYTEALLYEVESWNWQQFLRKNPSQELSGTSLPHLLQEKNRSSMIPWICSIKHKEYSSEAAGPHSIAFKPTLRWHRGQVIRRSRRWASAHKKKKVAVHQLMCGQFPTKKPTTQQTLRGFPQGTIQIKLRRGHRNAVGGMVLTHLPQPRLVTMPETVVLNAMHRVDDCPGGVTVGPAQQVS